MNISFLKERAVPQLSASELRELEELRLTQIPIPRESPDFAKLVQTVTAHINDIADGEVVRLENARNDIYETVVEAIYGKDVWSWINKVTDL